jgi:hypothetical protein
MHEKWRSAARSVLPDLNECKVACQCEKDRNESATALAWATNQLEHSADLATHVALEWLPDTPNAPVQCVFGDRIVKGHLTSAAANQKAGVRIVQLSALTYTFEPT